MKILCMTYEYPPIGGGGSSVAHPLARTLHGLGHSIDVVTSGMPDLEKNETIDGINVNRVPCIRKHRHYTTATELLTYVWPAYQKARDLQRKRQFDINHTHFAMPSGIASYMLYKKTGLPYVTTIHGSDVPGYNPDRFQLAHILARPLWRKIITNSARIISASRFLKNLIQTHIDVAVDIIPNGYSPDGATSDSPEKKNRILVVTRMFERKGVQHFLESLDGLVHNWEIVIAGDGPYLPVLREKSRRMNLNVRFAGYVQGPELLQLYETSKIFVFPSLQENFPIVLLEAMQAGCGIITTNADGCGEVIGDAGIVTDPERPDQIRAALLKLMQNDDMIQQLRDTALRRIESFRWPRIANQYDKVFANARVKTRHEEAITYLAAGENLRD